MLSCAQMMDGIDRIFWINLDAAIDRRIKMERMLAEVGGIECRRISAIGGGQNNLYMGVPGRFAPDRSPDKCARELGCLCSHISAIRAAAAAKRDEIALIMEDDMTLDFRPYWTKNIKNVIREAPEDWEIIQLCYITDFPPEAEYEKIEYDNKNGRYSTGAYLIRSNAARKFIEKIDGGGAGAHSALMDLSRALENPAYYLADHYLYSVFCTYTYKYPFFIYSSMEKSYICDDRWKFHEESRQRLEKMVRTKWAAESERAILRTYISGCAAICTLLCVALFQ